MCNCVYCIVYENIYDNFFIYVFQNFLIFTLKKKKKRNNCLIIKFHNEDVIRSLEVEKLSRLS